MKGLRLTAGWLPLRMDSRREKGRLFSGGNHPVKKVVGPAQSEPPIGAIKPARQIEDEGVGLSSKGEAMLEVKVENCAGIDVGKSF